MVRLATQAVASARWKARRLRLTKYQTEKGITSADQKLDVELGKLAEISSQLVQMQAQAYENASRQKQLEEFTSKNRTFDSIPEVLASPVIQELKTRLSVAEAKLGQASSTLGQTIRNTCGRNPRWRACARSLPMK